MIVTKPLNVQLTSSFTAPLHGNM